MMNQTYLVCFLLSLCFWSLESEHCHIVNSRRLSSDNTHDQKYVDFIVALSVPNQDVIHNHLLDISNPKSRNYGHYLTLDEIKEKYGPKKENVEKVTNYFQTSFSSPIVELSNSGDMIKVSAKVEDIENALKAELHIQECSQTFEPKERKTKATSNEVIERKLKGEEKKFDEEPDDSKYTIRSVKPIVLPAEIKDHIAFISLDLPTNYIPRKGKTHMANKDAKEKNVLLRVASKLNKMEYAKKSSTTSIKSKTQRQLLSRSSITEVNNKDIESEEEAYFEVFNASVTTGNLEAVLRFNIICGDGSWNQMDPPCSNLDKKYKPEHAEIKSNPFPLVTSPLEFILTDDNIYCYNLYSGDTCSGIDGRNCTCITKLAPLPKYAQLRASIYAICDGNQDGIADNNLIARSSLFALTDVATVPFLSELYNMPKGLTARHGARVALAEFYGEFFSNADLHSFLDLSGLKPTILPDNNIVGDNPNNELNPGGEATLDLQYIMGMAPQAKTTFYSFSDRNPFSYENEGFLAFLFVIGGDKNPPNVLSMSYGDLEASVFNTTRRGAFDYGKRCDVEFMKLGLRGVSIIFSSGDDGIGNTIMRRDKTLGCSKTWPGWPASSPYVTTVGATQLTDRAIPMCNRLYSPWLYGNNELTQIVAKCTTVSETVCTATNGCVITSGGGFSEIYDRSIFAPWQSDAVREYLSRPNYIWSATTHNTGKEMDDDAGGEDRRERKLSEELGYLMENDQNGQPDVNGKNKKPRPSNPTKPLMNFNINGRAFPDISAYGSNFFVVLNERMIRESGTSASAPVVAAMVTLWNDMRLANGLPVMGFLNPMLYAVAKLTPEAYNDITTGNNACGVGRSLETAPCCDNAFASAPGWDATTGLGTINYGIFARLVINNATFFPALAAYGSVTGSQGTGMRMPPIAAKGSNGNSISTPPNGVVDPNINFIPSSDDYNKLLNICMTALCLSVVSIVLWFCQVFKIWKRVEYTGHPSATSQEESKELIYKKSPSSRKKNQNPSNQNVSEHFSGYSYGSGGYQKLSSDDNDTEVNTNHL